MKKMFNFLSIVVFFIIGCGGENSSNKDTNNPSEISATFLIGKTFYYFDEFTYDQKGYDAIVFKKEFILHQEYDRYGELLKVSEDPTIKYKGNILYWGHDECKVTRNQSSVILTCKNLHPGEYYGTRTTILWDTPDLARANPAPPELEFTTPPIN